MSRLVILLGPVAAALGGIALGFAWDYLVVSALMQMLDDAGEDDSEAATKVKAKEGKKGEGKAKEGKAKPTPTFG